jgi:hypothetical protein
MLDILGFTKRRFRMKLLLDERENGFVQYHRDSIGTNVSLRLFRTKPPKAYSSNEGALGSDKSLSSSASGTR